MIKTLTITRRKSMVKYIDQVWDLLTESYSELAGGLHFSSQEELLNKSVRWRIVIKGVQVIAITIFKSKNGLKLIALGACKHIGKIAKEALARIIKSDLSRAWMELSEAAERFVLTKCGGYNYIIHATLVPLLLGKSIDGYGEDGYHYTRQIQNIKKTKIALGTFHM